MKRWLVSAAVLLALAGLGGLGAAVSGLIPIAASSGHWAITEKLLVFTKQRSVSTHTLGQAPPPLDDLVAVSMGAGHFEAGCRPCHGAPDLERMPRVPQAMLPPPPDLSAKVREYSPEELFYIVKHGIKFTGMPAWPAQTRDDEVAAVVAFLVQLPGMDAAAYRQLVHGEAAAGERRVDGSKLSNLPASHPAASHRAASDSEPLGVLVGVERTPRAVLASCGRCHGYDGLGRGNAAFPALAGQRQEYLLDALEAYSNDQRHSGIMQASAAALADAELEQVAEYYSRLPVRRARASEPTLDAAALARGRTIAESGVPERDVPACEFCHGSVADAEAGSRLHAPRLAGQYAGYLERQLRLLAAKQRGGARRLHLMEAVAPKLTFEQMRWVSEYYAGLEGLPAREGTEQGNVKQVTGNGK